MWNKINLRTRIYVILTLLVCITMVGGFVMVWYTYRMQSLLNHINMRISTLRALRESGTTAMQKLKHLGLSRPTLHSKIEKYRLKFDTLVKED